MDRSWKLHIRILFLQKLKLLIKKKKKLLNFYFNHYFGYPEKLILLRYILEHAFGSNIKFLKNSYKQPVIVIRPTKYSTSTNPILTGNIQYFAKYTKVNYLSNHSHNFFLFLFIKNILRIKSFNDIGLYFFFIFYFLE